MNLPLWQQAAGFAARAHRHQTRKDGRTPYVAHVYRVAMTVRDVFGCDDPVAITAALLHDTIEDTGTDYDDLRDHFGPDVADIVAALTKNMAMPEPQREQDYDRRLAAADRRARLIKLADQYDNLADVMSHRGEPGFPRLDKTLGKARRAIELAKVDEPTFAPIAAGIKALSELASEAEKPVTS